VLYLALGGITSYPGNYDYFLEKAAQTDPKTISEQKEPKENAYKAKKEKEAAKRKQQSQLKKTEESIAAAESELTELTGLLSTEEYGADYTKAMELSDQIEALKGKLEELYLLWGELTELFEKDGED
jgi:ATP-binding cassette subfamily F protein 3